MTGDLILLMGMVAFFAAGLITGLCLHDYKTERERRKNVLHRADVAVAYLTRRPNIFDRESEREEKAA